MTGNSGTSEPVAASSANQRNPDQAEQLNIVPPPASDAACVKTDQPSKPDELLLCLQFVAGFFGRSTDPAMLLAGLALPGVPVSVNVFQRCAERLDLQCASVSAHASELTAADLPAVARRRDGRPIVIVRAVDENTFSVFDPVARAQQTIAVADLADLIDRALIAISEPVATSVNSDGGSEAAKAHWLAHMFRHFWRSHLYVVMASLWINALSLAAPLFTMNVYDRVLPNKAMPTLWVLGIAAIAAALFEFALRWGRAALIDHVGRRLDLRASSRIMEQVLNAKFDAKIYAAGQMSQRFLQYEMLREFITSSTLSTFIDIAFSFIFLAVIFAISPYLALYPLFCLLVMIALGLAIQMRIGQAVGQVDATAGARQGLLVEVVSGIEAIKSIRGEAAMLSRWDKISAQSSNAAEQLKSYTAFAANFSQFALQTVTIATIIVGAYLFDGGSVSLGGIIAVSMLASRVVTPFGQIALLLARSRQAWSAFKSVDQLMKLPDERVDKRILTSRPILRGEIEFAGVFFKYPGTSRDVLKDFSVRIKPGERVGVIGRVGAGKTTIGRMLARYAEPDSGDIRIDGVSSLNIHPHEIRRAIKYVGQDAEVFRGTIRSNLLLARPDATDEQLIAAAVLAGVDEFANRHPNGYEMDVGERGGNLSSGQRQMIGLARNFLDPGLVLFLDDPTSSMDNHNERIFLERLKAVLASNGQTLIVTTHRNAVLSIVDRLVVLEGGRVAADGAPAEVFARMTGRSA